MGAYPSRNVTLSPRSEDPETVYLRNKVMEYLQTFDQSHSSQGRINRALGVIDVQSLQELVRSEEAMRGLQALLETESTRFNDDSRGFQRSELESHNEDDSYNSDVLEAIQF